VSVSAHELYAGDIKSVLVSEERIAARTAELGAQVGRDYAAVLTDQDLLLVTVLKGAVMFVTDLARAIPLPTQLEFMAVSSYGSATSSSGVVRILKDLDRDIADRDVLIVEDIVDSGLTLSWLIGLTKSFLFWNSSVHRIKNETTGSGENLEQWPNTTSSSVVSKT
jgi:hypoxanthine phosphoribosyltransferase